jgi:hypothetical protein
MEFDGDSGAVRVFFVNSRLASVPHKIIYCTSLPRHGVPIGLSLCGKNLKVGTGYNFTDFSDDLTDLKYNPRLFVNFVATKRPPRG